MKVRITRIMICANHLETCEGILSESTRIKELVRSLQILDGDVVVENNRLRFLDVAKRRHVEHHSSHVVRVAPYLKLSFKDFCLERFV